MGILKKARLLRGAGRESEPAPESIFWEDTTQGMGGDVTSEKKRPRPPRRKNGIVSRRRKPGERMDRSFCIRNFCRECMGWESEGAGSMAEAIRACPAPECWLYTWRNGKEEVDEL